MIIAGTIVLTLNSAPSETKSGIWLPESMTTEPNIGTVKHVGADKSDMKGEVVPGDVVVFNHKTHRRRDFHMDEENMIQVGFEDIYLIHKHLN
jgi:co-chaperonin GroES (HSP10)